jgi:hypothetical protein
MPWESSCTNRVDIDFDKLIWVVVGDFVGFTQRALRNLNGDTTAASGMLSFMKAIHQLTSHLSSFCEDHIDTYVIPFSCRWTGEGWRSVKMGECIVAAVMGWNARWERE